MTAFSPKQRTVLTWWVPGNPNRGKEAIVCDGAVRSGKTLAMGLSFFLWAMSCFHGQKFGVCGKTIASLRRNVLSEILPKLEALGAQWKEKRTDNLLTVKFRGRENQFYVFGGRDESSASLIQGITFAGVLLDEVALMPRSFVEQACARCSVAGSRLWFNCNPAGPGHWFYRTWILEAEKRNWSPYRARTAPRSSRPRSISAARSMAAMASGLRSLLDGLAAAGLKRPDDVRVCLSAGAALFRDWAFPFRSRAKVEQALSLMLETEFPFDADTLSHSVCLTGNAAASAGYKSGVQAISVSLRKEERDSWLDAFEAEGLFPRLVTVDPFPLLMNLPSRQNGMALLLYVQRGCSTLALLDNGVIRRIRTIPVGWTPETDAADLNVSLSERENAALPGFADRLRRETSLVLDGTPFVPDRLLAYGEAFLGNGASARFAEAFELPVSVLGQEVPLAGQVARLGETDPSRLLALCVAAMPLPAPWRPPLFPSFHRPPKGGPLSSEHGRRLAWAACGALAVGAACLASVWAEGYAAGQQAVGLPHGGVRAVLRPPDASLDQPVCHTLTAPYTGRARRPCPRAR